MFSSPIHRYPFLRLLLPFAAGIFYGETAFPEKWISSAFPLLFCILIGAAFIVSPIGKYSLRWLFGFFLMGSCFVGGAWWNHTSLEQSSYTFPTTETVYKAIVTDRPEEKEKSILYPIRLIAYQDSLTTILLSKKAMIYIAKDSIDNRLQCGDELLFSSVIASPKNNGNFDEFDYARYLLRKGISGTGFVGSGHWRATGRQDKPTIRQIATGYREKLLEVYHRLGFDGDTFSVLSALTVGYKDELSESITESYSIAGASHILALSGLHIGLISALLLFALKCIPDRWHWVKYFRCTLIVGFLWAFAFFTGLSPSVVRSVLMFSVLSVALVVGRKALSLNTLMVTAFFMLLYRPSWLFDVGFQLSFCAVAAILLIQPLLYRRMPSSYRPIRWISGLLSVSIAAQIGTAPLVIFYFSRFSTHFLITNLVVIPLVTIIIYAVVVMLALTPFPLIQSGMVWLVEKLIEMLNAFVRWVEQLPHASLDRIWLDRWEVAGIYLLFFLLLAHFRLRRAKSLLLVLSSLLLLCTYHTAISWINRPRQSLVFYNLRNCPAVHCIAADGQSWLVYAEERPKEERLRKSMSGYWNRRHLKEPIAIKSDYASSRICVYDHILNFDRWRVCIISDNHWKGWSASQRLSIDYLYICKGFTGKLEQLSSLFVTRQVVLDASLSEYYRQRFATECRLLGIPFLSLAEKGSVEFMH